MLQVSSEYHVGLCSIGVINEKLNVIHEWT